MDYSVWRIDLEDGTEVLWDGPLSQENAEKVRFTRQRDADGDRVAATFEVRPDYDLS